MSSLHQLAHYVTPSDAAEIDELGEQQAAYEAAKKTVKAFDGRKRALLARLAEGAPAEISRLVLGTKYSFLIDAAKQQRVVKDNYALADALGLDKFMELASVSIENVEKHVTEPVRSTLLGSKPGPRTSKFAPRQ